MILDDVLAKLAPVSGRLHVADGRLRVEAPAGAVPLEIVEAIRANKAALLSELRDRQQMCFDIVAKAVEAVAVEYPSGCLEALRASEREAIRDAEAALDAAAIAGDVRATEQHAEAFVATWKQIITTRTRANEILNLTVDEWCSRPDKSTLVLDTPHGEVLFVADRDAHARAIEEGKVVFSPLEVEQLVAAHHNGLAEENFVRTLIETKRALPGARLEEVRTGGTRMPEPKPESLADIGEEDAAQPG